MPFQTCSCLNTTFTSVHKPNQARGEMLVPVLLQRNSTGLHRAQRSPFNTWLSASHDLSADISVGLQ